MAIVLRTILLVLFVLACACDGSTDGTEPEPTPEAEPEPTPDAGDNFADAGDATPDAGEADPDAGDPDEPIILGGNDRPVEVYVPSTYDGTEALPLVMFFHGYGFSGAFYESSMNLIAEAEARGFFYIVPEGTVDGGGSPFWNASTACCNYYGSNVDDSAYLRSLIDQAQEVLNVDEDRIHVMGHSNGGFMAYRMACDHADVIASFMSFAGAHPDDATCAATEPVSALQIHGTNDGTVLYGGGNFGPGLSYPGAADSLTTFAAHSGCSDTGAVQDDLLDIDDNIPGFDTTVTTYTEGCAAGADAALWSVQNGEHIIVSTTMMPLTLDWLLARPKAN